MQGLEAAGEMISDLLSEGKTSCGCGPARSRGCRRAAPEAARDHLGGPGPQEHAIGWQAAHPARLGPMHCCALLQRFGSTQFILNLKKKFWFIYICISISIIGITHILRGRKKHSNVQQFFSATFSKIL
jgi:hypothetical protein